MISSILNHHGRSVPNALETQVFENWGDKDFTWWIRREVFKSCWLCQINGLYTVNVADPSVDENIESDIIPHWLTDEKPVNFLLKWAL